MRAAQLLATELIHVAFAVALNYKQDLPPAGGFETLKYKRSLPIKGPSGAVMLMGLVAICGYGFYRVGLGNLEQRELRREKAWGRIHLVPLLLAEGDRDEYRRQQAAIGREREIMKDVKGWEAGQGVYSSTTYRPRETIVVL